MSGETLVRVRLQAGRYEAVLTGSNPAMQQGLEAVHEGKVVAIAALTPDEARPDSWRVLLDLPAAVIADGVQVIAIRSITTGGVLDRITLMAGAPLDEDFRVELALLRDELEMLKRAFRRHCAETTVR
ncbi:hypothetical protein [Roseicyclus sp.]|uniref:hypothetical protein n=1 Tax=Roseicyclus sp. TaxID=1914329 RepID=UPI003F6ADE5E